MSISPISSLFDPYAALPVNRTGQDTDRQGARQEPNARHGQQGPSAPAPETPGEAVERAPGSVVGLLFDERA